MGGGAQDGGQDPHCGAVGGCDVAGIVAGCGWVWVGGCPMTGWRGLTVADGVDCHCDVSSNPHSRTRTPSCPHTPSLRALGPFWRGWSVTQRRSTLQHRRTQMFSSRRAWLDVGHAMPALSMDRRGLVSVKWTWASLHQLSRAQEAIMLLHSDCTFQKSVLTNR